MLASYYEDFNELILQVKQMKGERSAQSEASKTLKEAEKIVCLFLFRLSLMLLLAQAN